MKIFAGLFLLLSFLALLAVRLSEKGDIVDRNSGWILLSFLMAIVFFICSHYIIDGKTAENRTNKTGEELLNEIRKVNLKKVEILRKR
nr:hypothetical protein [uncultured Mucilaginibacter sp.]